MIKERIKELWRAQRAEMFGTYVDFFIDFLMKIRITPASDLKFLKTENSKPENSLTSGLELKPG